MCNNFSFKGEVVLTIMTNKAKVDRPYSNHTSVKLISLQLCLSFGNIEMKI